MNLLDKIKQIIYNIFYRNKIKMIDLPEENTNEVNVSREENEFLKSLRVEIPQKREECKIETLVFPGDGLGIKKPLKQVV